jgi:hypothetical protein
MYLGSLQALVPSRIDPWVVTEVVYTTSKNVLFEEPASILGKERGDSEQSGA